MDIRLKRILKDRDVLEDAVRRDSEICLRWVKSKIKTPMGYSNKENDKYLMSTGEIGRQKNPPQKRGGREGWKMSS